jgi:hypothetical protein
MREWTRRRRNNREKIAGSENLKSNLGIQSLDARGELLKRKAKAVPPITG